MVKISDHGEDHTPWATWEYHWGILNHFLKTCKIFRDRNLNRKQEIFRWRLFNLSTAQDEGWNANKHHLPEIKVWANLFNVQMVRVICCEQGIWRIWALMQLLIHRASALALLEDEQKFQLGGVLMAINSHFDRQLLGNKLSLVPCSIHILPISNKFHKFWWFEMFYRIMLRRCKKQH